MRVELNHAQLLTARKETRRLSEAVLSGVPQSTAATPIGLPSLTGLTAKAEWLQEQLPMMADLAAVAMLLDADGDGHATVTVPGDTWDPAQMVRDAGDRRFGPGFVGATGLAGEELADLLLTLGSVGQDAPPGTVMSPEDLRRFIIDHPQVAEALQKTVPMYGEGPAGTLRGLTGRDLFEGLSPADAAILAMTYPSIVGNLPGVPFTNRADANTVNVVAALAKERRELGDMRKQHERNQSDWDFLGRNNDDLEGPIKDLEKRIKLYESILNDNRTIVYFDPSDDGAIAELHGTIDAKTRNVGVLVPGTGSKLANYESGVAARSRSFLDASRAEGDSLAMISWMGGDLPNSVVKDAPFANYAKDLGPRLADFSRDLQLENERAGGSTSPKVTVAGHSYGGAVVGRSELNGLIADRVLHIESAGMGHGVKETGDLPSSQSGVKRYSMTAPGDPIELSQGTQIGDNIGHGADPDTFDGTTRLHTGDTKDGKPNTGKDAHTNVFQRDSDAWQNMYEVFVGGTAETYRSPNYDHYATRGGVVSVQDGWNDDGTKVKIP